MTHHMPNTPNAKTKQEVEALPTETNAALREIVKRMDVLNTVFEKETEALNNIDNETFVGLQEEKITLACNYQDAMTQMITRKNEIKTADPRTKQKLKVMQERFQDVSQRNIDALNRMYRCTERVGNTIRNAAVRAAAKDRGYSYGEDGNIPTTKKQRSISTGLSETV